MHMQYIRCMGTWGFSAAVSMYLTPDSGMTSHVTAHPVLLPPCLRMSSAAPFVPTLSRPTGVLLDDRKLP